MAPAFGPVEAKGLLPYFMDSATKARGPHLYLIWKVDPSPRHQMADKWSNIVENGKSGSSAIIDVNMWVGKATLDACVSALAFGLPCTHLSKGSVLELSNTTLAPWTMRITR